MKSRRIESIEAGNNVSFTESIVVTGDVGENAVINVMGNLKVKGKVSPGAQVSASGTVKIAKAFGPDTTIVSTNGDIHIGLMIDDVKTESKGNCFVMIHTSLQAFNMLYGSNAPEALKTMTAPKMKK